MDLAIWGRSFKEEVCRFSELIFPVRVEKWFRSLALREALSTGKGVNSVEKVQPDFSRHFDAVKLHLIGDQHFPTVKMTINENSKEDLDTLLGFDEASALVG